jgi:hypothetical protein
LRCRGLDEVDVLREVAFGDDHFLNNDQLVLAVWWVVVGMNAGRRYCIVKYQIPGEDTYRRQTSHSTPHQPAKPPMFQLLFAPNNVVYIFCLRLS